MATTINLRPSPIVGQWYPDDEGRLAASVDQYLDAATLPKIPGKVLGVVAPHAGHIYSGPVAGYAFAAVRGMKPDIVAVVSPMHQPYLQPVLTSAHDAYYTPLGIIPVDREAVQQLNEHLMNQAGFGMTPIYRDREHSLEIELPFLQRALAKEFSLLPVMAHDQRPEILQSLGVSLAQVLKGRRFLLVASTDLSHFYPQDQAERFDREMLRRIESFDPEAVLKAEEERRGFACGRGAVAATFWAARKLGANRVRVLHYATSGDITGDYHQVVGYGAAVITKSVNAAYI